MILSSDELEKSRALLTSDRGPEMMALLGRLGQYGGKIPKDSDDFQVALAAGWGRQDGRLTDLGQALSDTCRELVFWRGRDGALGWENRGEPLTELEYTGKRIVEIGSGMGVNLVTLQNRGAHVLGVEPVAAYAQVGQILWAVEGAPPVEIVTGTGEATGLDAAMADIVLCVSSLQYCEITDVLAEAARILKPGGQLVIYGDTFSEYVRFLIRRRSFGKTALVTLANSLSYSLSQRRVFGSPEGVFTTRPVYPVYARLAAWLGAAGFTDVNRKSVRGECLILAKKVA